MSLKIENYQQCHLSDGFAGQATGRFHTHFPGARRVLHLPMVLMAGMKELADGTGKGPGKQEGGLEKKQIASDGQSAPQPLPAHRQLALGFLEKVSIASWYY